MSTEIKLAVIIGFVALAVYLVSNRHGESHNEQTATDFEEPHNAGNVDDVNVVKDEEMNSVDENQEQTKSEEHRRAETEQIASEESLNLSKNVVEKVEMTHLSVTACGDRLEETVVMLKSAILLARRHLIAHIFAEDDLHLGFKQKLDAWPAHLHKRFTFKLYRISFPEGEKADEWKKLFKPCASQRLFLPYVLPEVDALIYVDTDILFMRPIDDLWDFFKEFNSSQLSALAPEHEDAAAGWYNRFAMHPYYGPLGMNSGVMLMNLTMLREFKWLDYILKFYKEYKLKITWGDQDLINIVFHYHPDKLYVYSCEWNYRPDHCMYMSVCRQAEKDGISIVHGSRGVYHNDKQPAFRAIYEAFQEYKLEDNDLSKLVKLMKSNLAKSPPSNCGTISSAFTKQFENQVRLKEAKSPPSPPT